MARISYISGSVSFARGDDPDNWQVADRNVPMSLGDRVYTNRGSRLELQVHGGDSIRLGGGSDLAALNLTDDAKQFSVGIGLASFSIWRLDENETFEVDTPNAAVTLDRPGEYRIDVDADGNTRILVRRGRATVAAGGGQVGLNSGEEMRIDGIDDPRYDVASAARPDSWDRWVNEREARIARARSHRYVSADIVGVDDLDEYGRWQDIPQYGRVWTPTSVGNDWAPYRAGHWVWQDPWGWTWISSEPWGWAPYHYGRWVNTASRWYWVPVAPSVRYASYSPALVGFVGGGSGWSASGSFGGRGGFVGWFPLAPREPLVPWWGRRGSAGPDVARANYVNRNYVTVVNQNTFVSGGAVTGNTVRDQAVLRDVAAAPVLRGPIPVMPTRESLRVSVRTDLPAPPRPPAALIERSVVVRSAPPPAPPSFQAKVDVIREGRGAPVEPDAAARLAEADRGRSRPATQVRPAAAESGRVTLAPRSSTAGTASAQPRPEPVAPVRGRAMATTERPVSSGPASSSPAAPSTREAAPPPRGEAAPRPATEAPAAPRQAPPSERERPPAERVAPREQPQPAQGREAVAPTPRPQPERAAEPPARGRESVAPTPTPQPEQAGQPEKKKLE
ncbi:MAG TPA: DUF6600 domain-containing protein, partial [Thermoanaerobaculia bacterium]|nr:DUF6600 domain-containing protein [Thermoanaerobaculia bacterium]